jgi:hypothetical protein
MEVKTIPVTGTMTPVSFYEDDTIDTVRQLVGLHVNTHPDRLFLEVKANLPKEYYATNPLHWTNLFLRLSLDGRRIPQDRMRIYLNETRVGTGLVERDVTKEEWENREEFLQPLYDPPTDFDEWRILGVDEVHSFVLPLPPRDIPDLQTASRPLPQIQSLYETLHPYAVTEIRVTPLPSKASPLVKLNYYPRLRPDTPNTIENLRASLEASRTQLQRLLELDTPKHQAVSIVRAKWYIPLLSTKFTSPRTRFEQMFYGMTVSPETPYVGYFTAKTETTRHKFYCEDVKQKKPLLDIPMWKGWTNNTQPQRRLPTLLLYRGTSRTSFDRIAITSRDITIDVRRDKDSTETLDELKEKVGEWMKSFDALLPFLVTSDIDSSRWELGDLSIVATYAREIREFDMHRFPCLQSLFGLQNDTFRLLRAEHTSDDITPRELQVLQLLNQDDAVQTPEYLAEQLGIPLDEAAELLVSVRDKAEELNLEKSLRAYPTIRFSNKELILKFVTNVERTLTYANILRHVLTADTAAVNAVCPRRMERVVQKVAVPQQEIQMEGELAGDDDFNALLGFVPGEEDVQPVEEGEAAAAPAEKKLKVKSRAVGTYNYFNNRLQKFDPDTFDKSLYPGKCDKPRQAIVMTAQDKAAAGPEYDFAGAPELEKLEITGLGGKPGTVICPPYWCMRDEIPLREDQLETGDDGKLHCPVCTGKLRKADNLDTIEYSVVVRDALAKFPDYLKTISSINKRKMPCCFKTSRPTSEVLSPKEEPTYVLDSSSASVPPLRIAYIPAELARRLAIETDYATSVKKGRIGSGESDVFRVGLGRPSKTLPIILGDTTAILRPKDAVDNLKSCSFFRTWKGRKGDGSQVDKIVASIDHAYQNGDLGMLEELEYVTTFLKCEVIRVDMESSEVTCGFWSESGGATSRTIVLLGNTILAYVARVKEKKAYKSEFTADLRRPMFRNTLPIVRDSHVRACAVNVPGLSDAVAELQMKNEAAYEVILDPFGRIQALFIPTKILLPIQPANVQPDTGIPVRAGYADITDAELPVGATARAFLADTKHAKFKVQSDVYDVEGKIVELELTSGFRIPIQPEDSETPLAAHEVLKTVRAVGEDVLADGEPNKADMKLAQDITYASEIYEFLLFSLSTHIATDGDGAILDPTYETLRTMIVNRDGGLYRELGKWFKAEAYEDNTKSPIEFVNKVRTPCGQFTDKDKCSKSNLCGWHKETCKIRVKPIVEKDTVLARMAKTLRDNDKQRALVLDGRMSPFFSTVLYLEMPHELITTVI